MCGINGFTFPNPQLIHAMNERVAHRGPDGEGVYVDELISLGQGRLAILDLSDRAKQPMGNNDESVWLVYNGELYNFRDLRTELEQKGFHFRSSGDTEVVLRAYEAYGTECFSRFNGMFALAIWDKKKETLILARDRIGIKPLYYFFDGARLIFSSEIKSILAHPIDGRVDWDAWNLYFRLLYVPAPRTMFQGISKLRPGSFLVWRTGEPIHTQLYWEPVVSRTTLSRAEAEEQLRFLLRDALRRQLVSDRPVGVFLSGGIDSTIVTALASEAMTSKIKTFSIAFDEPDPKFQADAALAKQTSAIFETDHHEVVMTGDDCLRVLHDVVYHMDEPIANTTQAATYLLSEFTRREVVVGLGGDGGDELFGGYPRYRYSQWISRYQHTPLALRSRVASLSAMLGLPVARFFQKATFDDPTDRYLSFMAQKEQVLSSFLSAEYNDPLITASEFRETYFRNISDDFEKDFMRVDLQTWLAEESLMRSDKMSMAFGLEQRVPFLDHRIVELALSFPTSWNIHRGEGKYILKQAMKAYLPAHVLGQPKRGWFSPTAKWLRGPLRELTYEVLSPSYMGETASFFQFDTIRRMIDDHMAGRAYHLNTIWAVLMFQMWYRRFL